MVFWGQIRVDKTKLDQIITYLIISPKISPNEVFGDIMVLAAPPPPPPPPPPVDPDDVNTLSQKVFNGSLSNFI